MGLLDSLSDYIYRVGSPATPGINPTANMLDPTREEQKRALSMGLLNMGAGILANNQGHYGAFAPALGGGLNQGISAYQQALETGPNRRLKQFDLQDKMMQRALYGMQVQAQMEKARKEKEEDDQIKQEGRFMLTSLGVNPDDLQGSFMQVSNDAIPKETIKPSQPVNLEPQGDQILLDAGLGFTPSQADTPKPQIDSVLDELGYTPSKKQFFYSYAKANPQKASERLLKEIDAHTRAQWKGKTEARDVLAKEKAMAEAMGVPIKDYLKQKMDKTGVSVSIVNEMAGEAGKKESQKEGFEIGEQAAAIENKWSAIDSVREAKDILSQGIYTGYWSDVGKTVAKASMGAIGDRNKAARTEQFMAYIGNTVVPRLKEFGGNDSNEEMRYLQRIMGGDTTMEPEALAAILDSAERKILRGIERLQRQRGALEQGKMPDLGAGPARGQKTPTQIKPLGKTPTIDDLLNKYGK